MTSDHVDSLRNPSSIKTRLAHRFVRALKKLSMDRPSSPVSMADRYKRYRMIRAAAYASMASSVGPRRAWARALLRKIRNRKMGKNLMKRRGSRTDLLKKRTLQLKPRNHREMCSGQENSLRELVPGGEGMDFCRLLNETGHYIKCLRAQVKVMKNIIDLYPN